MDEKFIFGGYFIVIPTSRSDFMDKELVPEKIVSISQCICDVVPGIWGLSWVKDREKDIDRIMDVFEMSYAEFLKLEEWVTEKFDEGKYGWQHGFSELNFAKEFAEIFLTRVKEYWIFSIGLSQSEVKLFLEEEAPQGNIGNTLIYNMLCKGKLLDMSNLMGFDILGYDMGGFHSYLCNGLEKDLKEKFNITPNKYGLYDNYELLLKGAEYISTDEVGAEPALWQPWAICLEQIVRR